MPLFVRPVVCLFGPSSYVYGLDSVNLVDLLLKREVLFGSKTDEMYMVSLGKRIIMDMVSLGQERVKERIVVFLACFYLNFVMNYL